MERKYLEYFDGAFDSTVAEKIQPENWPYVGSSKTEGVVYTIIPEPVVYDPWVTFTAEEANSTIRLSKLSKNQTLEYSADTTTWNTFDTTTNISLNSGDKVYVRGILSFGDGDVDNFTQFKMSGKIAAYGNCNALWSYEDLNAPLKTYCGNKMFFNCSALTTAPVLPATTLAKGCYADMFAGCTSLTTAPALPATTLVPYCYDSMFYNCTSLTTAPELPATELAESCYLKMFYNCTSLTIAPELPATTLTKNCYNDMFNSCTSLTTVPELPATELISQCYFRMFQGCTSLNYIKCLATNTTGLVNTNFWVENVSSTGTFVKHPNMNSWTTGNHGIPEGWTVENAVL